MSNGLNPRFVIWCRTIDREPHSLIDEDEIERIDGTPWTALFMNWVRERWTEWAKSLGYDDHRAALLNNHTAAEFDEWLQVWEPQT